VKRLIVLVLIAVLIGAFSMSCENSPTENSTTFASGGGTGKPPFQISGSLILLM